MIPEVATAGGQWNVLMAGVVCWGARLWNITRDNVSCLKGEANRRKAPSLKEFLAPVIMEMDPEEGIEDQYKVTFMCSSST